MELSLDDWPIVDTSQMAQNTKNPILKFADHQNLKFNPNLKPIKLALGDPTAFLNLKLPETAKEAVIQALYSDKFNGYVPSYGIDEAREAIAEYQSTELFSLNLEDVILTSGSSNALELCITVLANKGDNILIPCPGFSLYECMCESLLIECRSYHLLSDKNWEIDLDDLISKIDENTKAIIINNPSNPCGSVFSKSHQLEICEVLKKLRIPLIADEIYHNMTFHNTKSYLFAELSDQLPILSINGLAKRFCVPGWRFGWITIYDNLKVFEEIRQGLINLTTRILGPCSLIQAAIKSIIQNTPQWYFDSFRYLVEQNVNLIINKLKNAPGLQPIQPYGAIFMMVKIEIDIFSQFRDDQHFVEVMIKEISVFPLPASIFGLKNYMRFVLTVPNELLSEACDRLVHFCNKHSKKSTS